MTTREHILEYIAWNERMIIEFSEMARKEDTWPIELRECNYHDSVIRVQEHLRELRQRYESGNYDPVIAPSSENENPEK